MDSYIDKESVSTVRKSRNEEHARLNVKCSENITANTIKNGPNISDENINDTFRGDVSLTPKIIVNQSKSIKNKKLTLQIPDEDEDDFGVNISNEKDSKTNSLFSPNRANIQANNQ
jgi:hypothetical protein